MKRVIEFKGKDTTSGVWVYGLLLGDEQDEYPSMISTGEWDLSPNSPYPIVHQVHPESVGQYTGKDDADGKRIYEKDIIFYYGQEYYVQWSERYCAWSLIGWGDNERVIGLKYLSKPKKNRKHVIGNMFEPDKKLSMKV